MGVEALTRVFEHAPHSGMELLVLIALANIADAAGVCWPGHVYLSLYARVKHQRNLRQYLRALEATGNIYASKVAHRKQKAMYLVATAMSEEDIEHVLIHSFDLQPDAAQACAVDMIARQYQAETDFPLPLSDLRKHKRKSGVPNRRIGASSTPRRITRSATPTGIDRSPNGRRTDRSLTVPPDRQIARSLIDRGTNGSGFAQHSGSGDPQRRITRSTKADHRINSAGHGAASQSGESSPDPIMIHHDPSYDSPPPVSPIANNGGGGLSATTRYLQHVTDINTAVTEEFGDLPLDRVQQLVEQKRRAGTRDGGIVMALRALRTQLEHTAAALNGTPGYGEADPIDIEMRAQALAPAGASDLDVQWLAVFLEEGATDVDALKLLRAHQQRVRTVDEEGGYDRSNES